MAVTIIKDVKEKLMIMLNPDFVSQGNLLEPSLSDLEQKLCLEHYILAKNFTDIVEDYPIIKNPNDKWKVTSCMQKAIRRGHVHMAKKMASTLIEHDSVYFFRRINVIALEDVALANPIITAMVLCLSGRLSYLQNTFGLHLIAQFWVSSMALGVKDRTLCDYMCAVEYGSFYAEKKIKAINHPPTIKDFADNYPTMDFDDKVLMTRVICGTTKFSGDGFISGITGHHEAWCEWVWANYPPLVAYIAIKGSRKKLYNMWTAVTASYDLIKSSNTCWYSYKPHSQLESPLLKGVYAYAYDQHTLQGKKAISLFYKNCLEVKDLVESLGFSKQPLLAPMFIADTGLTNRHLKYDYFDSCMAKCYTVELRDTGYEKGMKITKAIERNISFLNECRRLVVLGG